MLDALTPLALSMQANRGAYALLLGSGVSRPSGIPTGYEIVLDLVRRVARLEVAADPPDLAAWYLDRFGKPAEYSDLLAQLAQTPAERSSLLRSYFEPTDEEREAGLKAPTAAHRAIAGLVKEGWVRVILTTNFDRVMESALAELDVRASVIDSSDDIAGVPPVGHAPCTLVKLHGDYLDTRIRNTEPELVAYDPTMNAFLDRVLDEYGLIVAGWSADYDGALREALARTPGLRYSTYWLAHGKLGEEAGKLVALRQARVVGGLDADQFFHRLRDGVHALDDLAGGAPLSVRAAVATAKRLLPRAEERIRLSDLVQDATERAREAAPTPTDFGVLHQLDDYRRRLHVIEEASAIICALMATGCRWGDDVHLPLWQRTIQRLGTWPLTGGVVAGLNLRRYPATLALYAGGIGALIDGKLSTAASLLLTPVTVDGGRQLAARTLAVAAVLDQGLMQSVRQAETGNTSTTFHTPANDHVHDQLRPLLRDQVPDDELYSDLFDRFEYLVSLAIAQHAGDHPLLGGRWSWRHRGTGSASEFVVGELQGRGDQSALVTSRLLPSAGRGLQVVETLRRHVFF